MRAFVSWTMDKIREGADHQDQADHGPCPAAGAADEHTALIRVWCRLENVAVAGRGATSPNSADQEDTHKFMRSMASSTWMKKQPPACTPSMSGAMVYIRLVKWVSFWAQRFVNALMTWRVPK